MVDMGAWVNKICFRVTPRCRYGGVNSIQIPSWVYHCGFLGVIAPDQRAVLLKRGNRDNAKRHGDLNRQELNDKRIMPLGPVTGIR
jgi:hypothetical protein